VSGSILKMRNKMKLWKVWFDTKSRGVLVVPSVGNNGVEAIVAAERLIPHVRDEIEGVRFMPAGLLTPDEGDCLIRLLKLAFDDHAEHPYCDGCVWREEHDRAMRHYDETYDAIFKEMGIYDVWTE
jgi:hypothetical protein